MSNTKNIWTTEKLSKLNAKELRNVRDNAARKNVLDLVASCDALLSEKGVFERKRNSFGASSEEACLEAEGDENLCSIAKEVMAICDLSEDATLKASQGVKGYRYLNILGKNGQSKLGGHKMAGVAAIDRYISFNIGADKIVFSLVLAKGQSAGQHKWFLSGPERLLPGQKPKKDLIPGMSDLIEEKAVGVVFDDFKPGAAKFKEMMVALTPPRKTTEPVIH